MVSPDSTPSSNGARPGDDAGQPTGAAPDPMLASWAAIVLERWRMVAATMVAAIVAAVLVSLIWPDHYTAKTLLALNQTQAADPRAQLLSSQLPMLLPGFGGGSNDSKLVGTVLDSRSLKDSVENRFGERVRFTTTQDAADGSITVEVTDHDPERATRAAAAFPDLINGILARLSASSRGHKEHALRQQVALARRALDASEDSLVHFQRAQHVPDIEEQARQTIDAVVALQQQIAEKEVALSMLRRTATPDNPQLRSAVAELQALQRQVQQLSRGTAGQILLPLQTSPELKAVSLRLLGQYTTDQQVYISLLAALTQAEVDAVGDVPTVNVVDIPVVPEKPTGAPLPVVIALAAILGLLAGIAAAIGGVRMREAEADARYAPLFGAWRGFRADLAGLVRFRRRRRRHAVAAPAEAPVAAEADAEFS